MAEFYQLSVEDVFRAVSGSKEGLSKKEVKERLKKFGANELPRESGFRILGFLLSQFTSPLVYILVIAGALSYWIGEIFDTIVIFASVAVNIGIGFYQEYSSSKILERLAQKVKVLAVARRDGGLEEVEASMLVPGDVVLIKSGMKIPADARIFYAKDLFVNEALLTGESAPVKKNIEKILGQAGVADRNNMVFMGSAAERGEGEAVVVKTGKLTQIGEIALLTKASQEEFTPLQEKISSLGKFLSIVVVIAALLIIAVGYIEEFEFYQIFVTAVAVAVAAIPEGLPAAIAAVLAVASKNIFKNNGLIKRLLAAHTFGSVSILLIDKTGTLTEGKMKLEKIISKGDNSVLVAIALANEAIIENNNGKACVKGEATDKAKLEAFFEKGLDLKKILEAFPRINFLPFDSVAKIMASFHSSRDQHGETTQVFISGAPEKLLELSRDFPGKEEMLSDIENLARKGFRVIGAAEETFPIRREEMEKKSEVELLKMIKNITFLGLAVIRDPIRSDVRQTVKEVRSAGIKI